MMEDMGWLFSNTHPTYRYNSAMSENSAFADTLAKTMKLIGTQFETLSSAVGLILDPPKNYADKILEIRSSSTYSLAYDTENPLVTIRISTYCGLQTLKDRCIPSIMSQTYQNFEVIVVGDNDPEPSEDYINSLNDPRFRYIQREYRGPYPDDKRLTWLISGAHCFNVATEEATGQWLTKLDQDDSWEPNHLEVLIHEAKTSRAEIVYGKCKVYFQESKAWTPAIAIGEYPPKKHVFALTTALVHGQFKAFKMNELSYLWGDPGDWGLTWRLWLAGAKFRFIDKPVANVYISKKDNSDYYEQQYQILLNAMSSQPHMITKSKMLTLKFKLLLNRIRKLYRRFK